MDRLEKSRRIQAKKLDKVNRETTKESITMQHQLNALRTAKQLLTETQNKKSKVSILSAQLHSTITMHTYDILYTYRSEFSADKWPNVSGMLLRTSNVSNPE